MNYYNEIKNELISNEVNKRVKDYSKDRFELNTYYRVGKLLIYAQGGEGIAKYGDKIIKEYARRLTIDLGKGFSERNLKNMRKFYLFQKGQTVSAQLTWSHYCELLNINNTDKINYYINISIRYNLSVRQLREKIKSNEYERLPDSTRNKLITEEETHISDFVKNPIIIKNTKNYEIVSEEVLQRLILEDIPSFLKELGTGFTFIDNEYKIKIGNTYNYIDLLLYNIKYKCYVVIELKTTRLKKEHTGQIQTYMNYIDKNIKTIEENDTVGIIICKEDNEYIISYCSDKRIISRSYELV